MMKVESEKRRMLVCFVLYCSTLTFTHSQECSMRTRGESVIVETYRNNSIAGRVSICDGSEWRTVCDAGWDMNDAMVVCRQLGFPTEGTQFCTNSCYGGNRNIRGATNFACTGTEQRLIDCTYISLQDIIGFGRHKIYGRCNSPYAGIICTRPFAMPTTSPLPCSEAGSLTPPTSASSTSLDNIPSLTTCPEALCNCTDTPTNSPKTLRDCTDTPITCPETSCDCTATPCPETSCDCTATPTSCPETSCESSTNTCSPCDCSATTLSSDGGTDRNMQVNGAKGRSATTPVLGGVVVIFLLILVGVVLGWVWSCHKNKQAVKQQGGFADNNLTNPTYDAATPTIPSIQYSSLGPQDTPTRGEEGVYHELEEVGAVEGQEGGAYEVPVQMGRDESAGRTVEMEYSTLQHN